nr:MAG TPA: hypothetical protein [Caudoviricetes sp.]
MKQQYWVLIIDGVVVDVDKRPKDRMLALKQYIMGTNLSLDDNALWFAENGGSCKLGHGFEIVETDNVGASRIVDDSIGVTKRRMESLESIKKDMETQE